MKTITTLLRIVLIVLLALFGRYRASAQTLFTEGDPLSDRNFNSDSGPTNSQLTLDFPITQSGTLQAILIWGQTDGQNLSGIGQSFQAFVFRPMGTNYQVVFETSYLTVTNVGTNSFTIPGPAFGLLPGDVLAHYGRGIPFNNNTGGPSSVYIASNLPEPTNGEIIGVPSSTYPLYSDGGRNYAIQVLASEFLVTTTNDQGAGSLRQAALDAAALSGTSTISFATNLSGQVILLTDGPINLSNNVTIDASMLANGIQINPNYISRIFTVNNATVVFNSLTLTNGNGDDTNVVYGVSGGAIENNSGTVTINNCIFTENAAYYENGGAIENYLGTMTVNNCSFLYNYADAPGNQSYGTGGGAIYNDDGHLTVNSSSFVGNSASNSVGGAIYCFGAYSFTANNCTFAYNEAGNGDGGAIYDESGTTLVMNNCTLVGNQATNGAGGGIYTSGNLNATNCIISLNSANTGADVYCVGLAIFGGGFLIGVNPLLAPLGNWGGPTPTMPPLPGSPALDGGTDSVTNFLATDQRGAPRKSGLHVDIGAVEIGPADSNTVVTTTADSGFGSLRLVVLDQAAFGNSNRITFTNTLSGQTITLTGGQIVLSSNVTIDASPLANGIQINGNGQSRIFLITNNATVLLNSLTLTNGNDNNDKSGVDGGGGGILNLSSLTVTNCVFTANQANGSEYGGGGILNLSSLTVTNCAFTANQANNCGFGGGGGINILSGTVTVNNSTFAANQANDNQYGGGGLFSEGPLTVNNSTFTGNQANNCGVGGGGIESLSPLTVNNSTIVGNEATNSNGGGIYNNGLHLNLTNCIICSNSASVGVEIENNGGIMSVLNCLLGPELLANSIHNDSGGTYSIASSVTNANALLAPLGNYGGPTQTMPPEPGSPALGAGNVTAASQFSTDQRGPGYARVVSGKVDIGSVEVQSGEDYSVVVNTLDSGPGSLRQVVSNAPFGAMITFDSSLSGQIITLTGGQIILSNSLYIYGTGPSNGIQINGNGTSRIFQVNTGTTAILYGLTLTNGNPGVANAGGAIFNSSGTLLELAACTLAGNSSSQGGAIENEGTCELFECTVAGNHCSGNGGAIDNNQGPLTLLQCTLADNTGSGNGGGVANYLNTLAMTNCIIAGNSGADIYNFASSTVNAGGTNIVVSVTEQAGSTFNGGSSIISPAPMLAPLGNYGGLTPTMPPLRGSPAIDGGSGAALAAEGFTNDQRGYPRVSGVRVDIGAVEVQIASEDFPLTELTQTGNGSLQFNLPNLVGGSFTVFATTNLALPFNTWSNLGPVAEKPPGSGVFQFTDSQATNFTHRFYRATSP